MLDLDLFCGTNDRPALFVLPTWQFAFFPSLASPNYWDLRAIMDIARANPIYANFRIATAFNNQAGTILRPAIFVDNDPTFANVLTDPSCIVARSHDWLPPGMGVVGTIVQVAMPPMSDLTRVAADGRKFITLGWEALVPTADFVAGGMDAFLTRFALPTRPPAYQSGY